MWIKIKDDVSANWFDNCINNFMYVCILPELYNLLKTKSITRVGDLIIEKIPYYSLRIKCDTSILYELYITSAIIKYYERRSYVRYDVICIRRG